MMSNLRLLARPALYATGVCGTCFCCAAIVQHERRQIKYSNSRWRPFSVVQDWTQKQRQREKNVWSEPWRRFTKFADQFSTSQKIAGCTVILNLAVFAAWRIPSLSNIMNQHFMSRISTSRIPLSPMILSCFSHHNPLHLALNMSCLYSFSDVATHLLGPEQLVGLFVSAGAVSSFTSLAHRLVTKSNVGSLGASGALFGVLAYICYTRPDYNLLLLFIPVTAGTALTGLMLLDLVGVIARWRALDHAAHLGGALFGVWYATHGRDIFNRHKGAIVERWTELKKQND